MPGPSLLNIYDGGCEGFSLCGPNRPRPIIESMVITAKRLARHWNWRISAQMRMASLVVTWLLVFGASLIPLMPVIGALRLLSGGAQMGLNQALAKRSPLNGRDRWDWAMLLLAFAGSVAISAIQQVRGELWTPTMLLVLFPYSVIQLRSYQRSIVAHAVPAPAGREPLEFKPKVRDRAA